jgi:hypothetical protein
VLHRDGGCSIHGRPYYPAVCKGFPWLDDEGERYEYDVTICGAFEERPELVEIQRAIPSVTQRRQSSPEPETVPGD